MEDTTGTTPPEATEGESPLTLKAAVRRARIEQAERSDVTSDLRAAEYSRLEMLKERLDPIFAQAPVEADLFDHGLIPGERPRFYVDMVAFIEMSRDRRTYRFLLDTRNGRQLLGESDDLMIVTSAVTNYLARRLVEREKALTSEVSFFLPEPEAPRQIEKPTTESPEASTPTRNTNSLRSIGVFSLGIAAGIALYLAYLNWNSEILPMIAHISELLSTR